MQRYKKISLSGIDGDGEEYDLFLVVSEDADINSILDNPESAGVVCDVYSAENADLIVAALNRYFLQ